MHAVDGVLVIDKPEGLTSHDVVAVARRILHQPRVGHAGTLDPLATGVLVLACGRATRLMRFLSASDKTYDATILFGVSTDTYDVTGQVLTRSDVQPSRDALDRAVSTLTGEYLQQPPAFSARKVDGERAYALARQRKPVTLKATPVRVSRADVLDYQNGHARVTLTCSAGFYVRSFAHSLGDMTGSGACLEALRRTRSGDFGVQEAVTVASLQGDPSPEQLLTPLERLLPSMPGCRLTDEGVERVSHGRTLDPRHLTAFSAGATSEGGWVRLLHPDGRLVALAEAGGASGTLHPSIVMI